MRSDHILVTMAKDRASPSICEQIDNQADPPPLLALPAEITMLILGFLDTTSLLQTDRVCKHIHNCVDEFLNHYYG